ncbi:MAG: hypothetical protein EOR30_28035 [Mesorhizobium sp.]|uniref:hypothetical protein n=1 Tax=unclassified Mesorhizobium TaxID=325217 RepID=UPI000FCAB152|nr:MULTISPECIES: hypothetical protein [unclassified Mesorhizobium]RUV71647.1 hypothetical protein EOA78_16905 [Mesorhizobium sp. M5C.F.Cr.IN.023.01.1.1]RWF88063.1 MAG: hypothetical protein EOQ36_09725 [Mesorhizobium sp.]RWI42736.1 MAG: hypothetical protein EOR14_06465 [Mesorhizobium sp.]RWI53202.1 MAG: hypothetical protein EOR15_00080 [Mesorhizobium sp.]RWI60952.1 MAG: hypothetical protein EOR16_06560 [Mesorhizobium sp.]
MSNRYATIITDDDGREVVSAIGEFEGVPDARRGRVEPVADGVRIGMVRGGSVDAVGGFGFSQTGVGAGAMSSVRAALKALSGAGKSGSATGAKLDAARSARKPTRAKPGKRARKKPARPAKKTAKPAMSAGTAG